MNNIHGVFRPESKYKAFFLSMLTFGLAYGLYKGVLDNYLAEAVSMSEFGRGVSEFFRELPGLALVFILAALYTFSAEQVYKIGAVIMIIGMALHAVVPANQILVTISILVYSLGDHMQQGTKNALSLEYSKEGHGGMALGLQNAIYQIGTLAGYLVIVAIFFVAAGSLSLFRNIFWITAAIIGVGFLFSLRMTGYSETDKTKRRFYFRKK